MIISTEYIVNKIKNQIKRYNVSDKAAVLIPIIKNDRNQLCLLFEIRALTLKSQPGDICFPGGRLDIDDTTVIDTVIRETYEEIGIAKNDIKIYGQLPSFTSNLGFKIYPVVGELTSCQFNLNNDEVSDVFIVPIEWFIHNPPIKSTIEHDQNPTKGFPIELIPNYAMRWPKSFQQDVYFYQYDNHIIWGLTAQIIQLFLKTIE